MKQSELETKHAASAKPGKTHKQCQARENVQTMPNPGKRTNDAKCGEVRENVKLVLSAGKHKTDSKRGKTCNRGQARENVQPPTGQQVQKTHVI